MNRRFSSREVPLFAHEWIREIRSLTPVKIKLIAAARPDCMTAAPLYNALRATDWCHTQIADTGPHDDINMSDVNFQDLDWPKPTITRI